MMLELYVQIFDKQDTLDRLGSVSFA